MSVHLTAVEADRAVALPLAFDPEGGTDLLVTCQLEYRLRLSGDGRSIKQFELQHLDPRWISEASSEVDVAEAPVNVDWLPDDYGPRFTQAILAAAQTAEQPETLTLLIAALSDPRLRWKRGMLSVVPEPQE